MKDVFETYNDIAQGAKNMHSELLLQAKAKYIKELQAMIPEDEEEAEVIAMEIKDAMDAIQYAMFNYLYNTDEKN